MTSEQQTPANRESKPRRWPHIVVALLLGFLLGYIFEAHFRPNYITFEVENGTRRVNVVPRKGDRINWLTQTVDPATAQQVTVRFLGVGHPTPCSDPNDASICKIDKEGYYEYECSTVGGASYPCADPGVDPKSTTNGATMIDGFKNFKDVVASNTGLFQYKLTTVDAAVTGKSSHPVTGTSDALAAGAFTDYVHPVISCDGSGKASAYLDPQPVYPGEGISWTAGQIQSFSITVPAGTCDGQPPNQPMTINSNPNAYCKAYKGLTPGSSVTYTISTSGNNKCAQGGSASLSIQPPPTP